MDLGKVEQLRDEVIGLRPVYCEIGNSTELLLKNGTVVLDKRIVTSTENALVKCYAIDRAAQRQQLQVIIDRKGGPYPLCLPKRRVFIPLKMRRRVTDNDSVYGYVDMQYMGEPQSVSSNACRVELTNGLRLELASSCNTVLKSQHDGIKALQACDYHDPDDISDQEVVAAIRLVIKIINQMLQRG